MKMKQSKNLYLGPNAMKFTLSVATSKEGLNLKFDTNSLNNGEDIDHFLVTVEGKYFLV